MVAGICQIRLQIPGAHSLKEKRTVVRSLVDRLRARYNLSVAEVGEHDTWQIALLGLAAASVDGQAAEALLAKAAGFVTEQEGDYIVLDVVIEVVAVSSC